MIIATLTTPNGINVLLNIPESAKEIPFSKYVSANIEYVSICERFDEQQTNYTGAQLNDIVRFLSFVLGIDAKILLGFKVGKLNDIAAKMSAGLDAKGTWEGRRLMSHYICYSIMSPTYLRRKIMQVVVLIILN